MRSENLIKTAKSSYVSLSLVMCAMGILFLLWPDLSITAIGIIVGCVLTVFGMIKLVGYFSKDLYRLAFEFDLALGLLMLVLGVVVLACPELAMGTLCVILGVAIVTDSLFKIQMALDARRFGLANWWLVMLLAVLTGLAGVMMIVSPIGGAVALTVVLGASLLTEGALNLCVSLCAVKVTKRSADTYAGGRK